MAAEQVFIGDWTVCFDRNQLSTPKNQSQLENKPMEVLRVLFEASGELVSKDEILDKVWSGRVVGDEVLSVAVSQLRKVFGDSPTSPSYIKTHKGKGYSLIAPVHRSNSKKNPGSERKVLQFAYLFGILIMIGAVLYSYLVDPNDSYTTHQKTEPSINANKATYVSHQQAIKTGSKQERQAALKFFEQYAKDNARSAQVYVDIAESKRLILDLSFSQLDKQLPEYKPLLEKAVSLESTNHYAHSLLGSIYFANEWNFALAERHWLRAIEHAPLNTSYKFKYTSLLLAMKRFEEARIQIKDIRTVDPLTYSKPLMSWVHTMQKDYKLALNETQKLLQFSPDKSLYHWLTLNILQSAGNKTLALPHLLALLDQEQFTQTERLEYRSAADIGGLDQVIRWLWLEKQDTRDFGNYTPPMAFARYAITLNMDEQAIDYLEQAFEQKQKSILWLNVDPRYDSLRSNPRFQRLIHRLNDQINTSL